MATMPARSYAAEDASWLLFAREEAGAFVFTALATCSGRELVAELAADAAARRVHAEELGLETDAAAFSALLRRAMERRRCVDVEVADDVALLVTYELGAGVSRTGAFRLPVVASDPPLSLVTLLKRLHAAPARPMLTEQQQKMEEKTASAVDKKLDEKGDEQEKSEAEAADKETKAVNTMIRKRRHLPTGTMRRKGPRGAKLAKN